MTQFENNAKCFFIYFLIFILSIMSGWGCVGILDLVIEIHYLGKPTYVWAYSRLWTNIAFLCIGFPLLVITLFIAQRNLKKGSFSVQNSFRKWILYGSLAIASIFILYGMSQIGIAFLKGTLFSKVLAEFGVLIIVAGFGFIYGLIDISRTTETLTGVQKGLAFLAVMGFIGTLVLGLPHNKTQKEFDALLKEYNKPLSSKKAPEKPKQKKRS